MLIHQQFLTLRRTVHCLPPYFNPRLTNPLLLQLFLLSFQYPAKTYLVMNLVVQDGKLKAIVKKEKKKCKLSVEKHAVSVVSEVSCIERCSYSDCVVSEG